MCIVYYYITCRVPWAIDLNKPSELALYFQKLNENLKPEGEVCTHYSRPLVPIRIKCIRQLEDGDREETRRCEYY